MSAPDRLTAYLMANPGLDFCDECLGGEVGLASPDAREARLALRGAFGFEQHVGPCSVCQRNRLVVGCPLR